MAAVDEGDAAVVVELGEHGRDEVLLAAHGVHDLVERRRDGAEVGHGERGLPEGADDRGGELDGVQALAPHVTHDHPDAERRRAHLVEIAADERVVGGGHVPRGERDVPDRVRHRPQDGALRGLGHYREAAQPLLAPLPFRREEHGGTADQRAEDQARRPRAGAGVAVPDPGECGEQGRHDGEQRGPGRRGAQRRQHDGQGERRGDLRGGIEQRVDDDQGRQHVHGDRQLADELPADPDDALRHRPPLPSGRRPVHRRLAPFADPADSTVRGTVRQDGAVVDGGVDGGAAGRTAGARGCSRSTRGPSRRSSPSASSPGPGSRVRGSPTARRSRSSSCTQRARTPPASAPPSPPSPPASGAPAGPPRCR